jgi:hypothetical protein
MGKVEGRMTPEQQGIVIDDEEGFNDFRDALSDYAPRIETLVAFLRQQPQDAVAIADLFRLFHNIKGDAGLCRLDFLVAFMHAAETLLARVRAGEVVFSGLLADVLLLAVDRLQLTVDMLDGIEAPSDLHLDALVEGLQSLREEPAATLDAACQRLIDQASGSAGVDEPAHLPALDFGWHERSADLMYFYQLALQLERRSTLFTGRTERNLKLALLTNQIASFPVDVAQLYAACCVHDIGMMFLPESLWIGSARMTPEQRRHMSEHASWGGGLLQRMPGWEEAARMVWQHHEKPDGSGYPLGLYSSEIVAGAKILALVDAFESGLVKQGARGPSYSVMRAGAEVNAADRQFDPLWLEPFNRAVRTLLHSA